LVLVTDVDRMSIGDIAEIAFGRASRTSFLAAASKRKIYWFEGKNRSFSGRVTRLNKPYPISPADQRLAKRAPSRRGWPDGRGRPECFPVKWTSGSPRKTRYGAGMVASRFFKKFMLK
jgi:hypothetical protein